jgi:hypothetical protein
MKTTAATPISRMPGAYPALKEFEPGLFLERIGAPD